MHISAGTRHIGRTWRGGFVLDYRCARL